MDSDERGIYEYLKTWGVEYINAMEIARRATDKRRFYSNPDWAKPVLMRMTDRGLLECNMRGCYRIKPVSRKKDKRWVAPDIAKILQESGVEIETGDGIAPDGHNEEL